VLSKNVFIRADIALSALETFLFSGCIRLLIYLLYLLLGLYLGGKFGEHQW